MHRPGLVRLQNPALSLEVLPAAGGKLVSLCDRRSGHEWLWSNPRLPHGPAQYGADFGAQLDTGGWDDVFPSVTPLRLGGPAGPLRIPDHGEVVGLGAQVLGQSARRLTTAVEGRALSFRFTRTIALDAQEPRAVFDYTLENTGAGSWPWLYCAHALLDAAAGLQIQLPAEQAFEIFSAHGRWSHRAGLSGRWPELLSAEGSTCDLSRCLLPAARAGGYAAKLFVRSPADGSIGVQLASAEHRSLRLHYDPLALPWLGLWINNRGWTGSPGTPYLNLGVEPATAGTDDLEDALARGEARELAPGATAAWRIAVELR